MGDERYTAIKRGLAVLVAIALWFLSIQFSVAGFNIEIANMAWAGWVLGFSVTVIELIFTSESRGRNITLTALGITAYAYGIWSNIAGINASRGVDGFSADFLFSVVIGLILEIAPEPLFLWGILGGDTAEGDIVGTLSNLWRDANKRPVGRPRTNKFPIMASFQPKPPRTDTVSNRPKQSDNYLAATRLSITASLNRGGMLVWDKDKSQSPLLIDGRDRTPVSRSLIRQMVADKTLIEKWRGDMMVQYILSGSEPPMI